MSNAQVTSNDIARKYWLLFPVIAVFGITTYRYLYVDVLGEADLVRVAFGVLFDERAGFHATPGMHYGLSFSFGYYWLLHQLLPHAVSGHSDTLFHFINASGFVSGLLILSAAGLLLARLYTPLTAALALILFGFSPMFIELATSGHPILPATACLLVAGNLLLAVNSSATRASRFALSMLSIGFVFLSLSVRAETAMALPWLAIATSGGKFDRAGLRPLVARSLLIGVAVILFLYCQNRILALEPHASSIGEIHTYLSSFYDLKKVFKGIAIFVLAFGIVSALIALALPASKFFEARQYIFHCSVLILPTLVLWLPNPTPSRHFLFAFLGLAILAGNTLPLLFRRHKTYALVVATAAVIANQFIAELLYPTIVARYDWTYPKVGERRSTFAVPLGLFALNHQANAVLFSRLRQEGRLIAALTEPNVVIFGDELHYMLLSLLDSGNHVTVIPDRDRPDSFIVTRGHQRFHLIHKEYNWPRDTVADYIAKNDMRSASLYIQPYTISRYDKLDMRDKRIVFATLDWPNR